MFGQDADKGLNLRFGGAEIVGKDEAMVWDPTTHSPVPGFLMAQLDEEPELPSAIGVFRDIQRPTYDGLVNDQINDVTAKKGPGVLKDLIYTPDAWVVE